VNIFQRWVARNKEKRLQELRDRLGDDLAFFYAEDNVGLLRRRLVSMPGVETVTNTIGGWRKASVEVIMNDGFTCEVYGDDTVIAFREAAFMVVGRLQAKHSLGDGWLLR